MNHKHIDNTIKKLTLVKALISLLVFLILVFTLIYIKFSPTATQGKKNITIELVYENQSTDTYEVTTDSQYLEQAITEAGIMAEGERTDQFGLMIVTINDIRADYTLDGAYWAVLLDGKPCNYGISQQPIRDGERYQIVYTYAR